MTEPQPQIVATNTLFYREADEEAFIGWVDRMTFVRETYGVGRDMFLILNRFPADDDMWKIIGFCRRYGIDMPSLPSSKLKRTRFGCAIPPRFGATKYSVSQKTTTAGNHHNATFGDQTALAEADRPETPNSGRLEAEEEREHQNRNGCYGEGKPPTETSLPEQACS